MTAKRTLFCKNLYEQQKNVIQTSFATAYISLRQDENPFLVHFFIYISNNVFLEKESKLMFPISLHTLPQMVELIDILPLINTPYLINIPPKQQFVITAPHLQTKRIE